MHHMQGYLFFSTECSLTDNTSLPFFFALLYIKFNCRFLAFLSERYIQKRLNTLFYVWLFIASACDCDMFSCVLHAPLLLLEKKNYSLLKNFRMLFSLEVTQSALFYNLEGLLLCKNDYNILHFVLPRQNFQQTDNVRRF